MLLNKKWVPFIISLILRIFLYGTIYAKIAHILTGLYYASMFSLQSIKNLKYKIVGIDLLITIAVFGALIIGEYWEMASVTFLYLFGNELEKQALYKTNERLRDMMKLVPTNLRLENNELVSIEEIDIGTKIKVLQGEIIPVDGLIVTGDSTIDESSITGESLPIYKSINDFVYMGTIVKEGFIIVETSAIEEDTIYGQILDLIETAQNRKSNFQRTIDKFSQYYTPFVIILSFIAFIILKDIHIALSLLVVSCPGALVIAIPIASSIALGNAAKSNILIKGIDVLESLNTMQTIAFDKTGTLTKNELKVIKVIAYKKNEEEILNIAASIESHSEHPIANAIVKQFQNYNYKCENLEFIAGKGIIAYINDKKYIVGQESLFSFEVEHYSNTTVYVGDDNEIFGIILLSDTIREDAKNVISDLSSFNIMMLTGDNYDSAVEVGNYIGISNIKSRLLPEEKLQIIRDSENIIMVGDGINDSPSLMESDIGISMGGSENRVAMETSDVILMDKNLKSIPKLIKLAKKTKHVMIQNMSIAILTALVLFAGVLDSKINLSIGMLVHELSILAVIINANRLRW
ncbi:MAG: cadmium-translocating P-type ATPase [Erysipelotrichaceae bacterium]|nr:cadmium-translocating P-type ATPase [Erysipelotrichaceae bacterium]